MFDMVRARLLRALPLLAASLAVAVGTYFVGMSAIYGLQSSQAEFGAKTFAKYLVREVPDLLGVINGQVTSGKPIETLAAMRPIGTVFKYRIYDPSGTLKVDYSPYAQGHVVDLRNSFEDLGARGVSETGRLSFELHGGDGQSLPLNYSEVMVPLIAGNRAVGVLSVLTDETETMPEMFAHFRTLAGQIGVLILLAFGVPVILYVRKISQLEGARRRLRYAARHDALTGLLNRTGFNRALSKQLGLARQGGAAVAVHIVDLDRFKDVNEAGGQTVGDAVLKQTSERILQRIGPLGQLARLGADEFAVLQAFPSDDVEVVRAFADEIADALSKPFVVGSRNIETGASVGFACWPSDAENGEALIRAADVALHQAKQRARGRAIAFNATMEAERQIRHRIERRLRLALANHELMLHFQPVFEIKTGHLRGFEALVRLNDDAGRPIPPSAFIPVAEEVGLIGDVGAWVLREACRVAGQWPDDLFVAVNLSPAQFTPGGIARQVRDVLSETGLRPGRLELEVTESLFIGDSENVLGELNDIKSLGASLTLDDFGTGFSSLSYLWRFPFDKLKVDRSFMADLTVPGSPSREILSTIIALGRVLNLKVTAEGVETEAQVALLRELDCDLVQGFLYGRPQPETDIAATILKAFTTSEAAAGSGASLPADDRNISAARRVAPSSG